MKQRARHAYRNYAETKPGMAAMIDVVFLLLIFFLAVIKPVDILSHLPAVVGAPEAPPPPTIEPTIRLGISRNGYVVQGARKSAEELDLVLATAAKFSPETIVHVTCTPDSRHADLVRALDLCAKWDLEKIALVSGR